MKKADLIFSFLRIPVDCGMFFVAGLVAYFVRISPFFRELRPVLFEVNLPLSRYIFLVVWAALLGIVVFAVAGQYRARKWTLWSEFLSITLAASLWITAIIVYLFVTLIQFDSRFLLLAAWPLVIFFVFSGRLFLRLVQIVSISRFSFGAHRVLVVGDDPLAHHIIKAMKENPSLGYVVAGHIPEVSLEKINAAVVGSRIDEIVLSSFDWPHEDILALMRLSQDHQLSFKFAPNVFQMLTGNTHVDSLAGVPLVEIKRTPLEGWGKIIKRAVDILGGCLGIILFALPMAIIALAIKVDSSGPILYKNQRVGPKGTRFFVYKFRSMKREYCTGPGYDDVNRSANSLEDALIKERSTREGPVFKILNDPRRTRVGRILERTSLDELPQFLNVLFGTMSLVGPRPHMPKEVEKYEQHHKKVFNVKPGLTGLSQISGRSDLDFEKEVRLDTYYVENWSLWLDLVILFKTPPIVILRRHR